MSNITKIRLNSNNISKEKSGKLNYSLESIDENLFYSNLYSNILVFYNVKYKNVSNNSLSFKKYFVLSELLDETFSEYTIRDDIDQNNILEKKGFVKYLPFKNGSLSNIFKEDASDEEKEDVVASLNRISPKSFVKIDRIARNILFKKLEGDQDFVANEKARIFQKIFNIVEKNLPRLEISKVTNSSLIQQQTSSVTVGSRGVDNTSLFKNNIIERSETQKRSEIAKRFETISQTSLNAILDYNYVNCKKYYCNRKLSYNNDKNKNFFYIEKIERKSNLEVEIDISDYLDLNVDQDLCVYRHINIEYYSENYKQTDYKTYNNNTLIDPEHLFIEKMSNIKLNKNILKVNSNKGEKTCFFNKEYYSRANAIWSLKNIDNRQVIDNSNFNSLKIKRIFERYVVEMYYQNKTFYVCFNNTLNNPQDVGRSRSNMFLEVNRKENLTPNIVITNIFRR